MPEVYAKKVPREESKEVPGVACHLVLEQVETPKCYPVPVEECDDILKEIPYLVEDEECNQVPRLDCNVVSTALPQYPNRCPTKFVAAPSLKRHTQEYFRRDKYSVCSQVCVVKCKDMEPLPSLQILI